MSQKAELDTNCRDCGVPNPKATAETAAHDETLIDLIVTCDHCGLILNAFISLDEMTEVPNAKPEEPNHG